MTVTLAVNAQTELLWHSSERLREMIDEKGFVRRCQTRACKGAPPFGKGERLCRLCGRSRPHACATILIAGGSAYDSALVRDALDAEFNSLNFVGQVSGRVSRVDAGTWSIDDADLLMPPSYDSKAIPASLLVAAALRRSGLSVAATPLAR